MHMISKKDLSDAEVETLTKSCCPTIVMTANGEVQTHEEATVYVKELDIFLTMEVLENTPAVLSLGKLCDEKRTFLWVDQRLKTTSHLKTWFGYNATRRTSFLSWFQACQRVLPPVFTLQPQWHLQDRGGIILHLLRARLLHQLHQMTVRLERERIKLRVIPLQCMCQVLMLMIEREDPLLPWIQSRARSPSQPKIPINPWKGDHDKTAWPVVFWNPGVAARIQRRCGGWWNSWTRRLTRQFFSWSIFRAHIQETRIWVNTVLKLISLRTEIAKSVRGPRLQGPHAEDAMAKPYLVLTNLVTW